jgi:SAM-dependent methyltransferase
MGKRENTMRMNDDPFAVIADYYDLDLGGFQEDVPLYDNLARRTEMPVLELGTGTGRVAIPLAKNGHTVVGIDSSEAMLTVARRNAGRRRNNLQFILAEMTAFSFDASFGLVFCALGGFLHLDSQAKQIQTLERVRDHLAASGLFTLDLPNPEAVEWEPGCRELILEWTRERQDGTMVSKFVSTQADRARQVQRITHIYEEWHNAGSRRRQALFELRHVHRFEMELLLRHTGWKIEGVYGSYDLEPYDSDSPRMIFVAGCAR